MDSAVGALCLGYFYTVTTGDLYIPVLNSNSDDFYCKMEIVKHMINCKIPEDQLFFLDQLKAHYPNRDDITETAIVDHN